MEYFYYAVFMVKLTSFLFILIMLTKIHSINKKIFWIMLSSTLSEFIMNAAWITLHTMSVLHIVHVSYNYMYYFYLASGLMDGTATVLLAVAVLFIVKALRSRSITLSKLNDEITTSGRGALILTFGIMSLVGFMPLGIVAWVMGRYELAAMNKDDSVDYSSSKRMTEMGTTLGKIGTWLMIAMIVLAFLGAIYVLNTASRYYY